MRIVVLGATGNVGTSVLAALERRAEVDEVVAVARRAPSEPLGRARFVGADVARSDLVPVLRGADAVVHLAWLIQPARKELVTYATNVRGSERVFRATVEAGVPALVYASSVGAYSPGPKDRRVDESWPTDGVPSSFYSRQKVAVERQLDRLEREHPALRVVRMRPGLIFKAAAATEIRRLFVGPLVPRTLMRPDAIPLVPDSPRLRFQAVHSLDVGEAYCLAVLSDSRGAFNLAADPPLDGREIARALHARAVPVPAAVLRGGATVTHALRLQPSEPGWVDLALSVPLMDGARAASELGWQPSHGADRALVELLEGMSTDADFQTPPLSRRSSGPGHVGELSPLVG